MEFKEHLEKLLSSLPLAQRGKLKEASQSLSERYAKGSYDKAPLSKLERYAYLMTRMPATFAAVDAVLEELRERLPQWEPKTIVDLGAGPGTASWAVVQKWPDLESCQLVEQDGEWIKLGQYLSRTHRVLAQASWIEQDVRAPLSCEKADLLIASYVLQELDSSLYAALAGTLWEKTKGCLVLIEPGTPRGFANLRLFRTLLLNLGAHVVAPCTHQGTCPLEGTDWCHFSTRLVRDDTHRLVKNVSLGYEDEKYAYLIVSHRDETKPHARLIRAPIKRAGHVIIDTCAKNGLGRMTIPRSHKSYKQAKKLQWGSVVDHENFFQGKVDLT